VLSKPRGRMPFAGETKSATWDNTPSRGPPHNTTRCCGAFLADNHSGFDILMELGRLPRTCTATRAGCIHKIFKSEHLIAPRSNGYERTGELQAAGPVSPAKITTAGDAPEP